MPRCPSGSSACVGRILMEMQGLLGRMPGASLSEPFFRRRVSNDTGSAQVQSVGDEYFRLWRVRVA
jgi:hypothetical protein